LGVTLDFPPDKVRCYPPLWAGIASLYPSCPTDPLPGLAVIPRLPCLFPVHRDIDAFHYCVALTTRPLHGQRIKEPLYKALVLPFFLDPPPPLFLDLSFPSLVVHLFFRPQSDPSFTDNVPLLFFAITPISSLERSVMALKQARSPIVFPLFAAVPGWATLSAKSFGI